MTNNHENPKNIAVIGAGIVGVSTAEWLRRDGHQVTLIERLKPAQDDSNPNMASYGNAGVLARLGVVPVLTPGQSLKAMKMLFNPQEPLFMRWSYLPKILPWLFSFWRNTTDKKINHIAAAMNDLLHDSVDMHRALAQGTPAEKYIHDSDYLYIYPNKAAFESDHYSWALREKFGVMGKPVEGKALEELVPGINPSYHFGWLITEKHGKISDPGRYLNALTQWFLDHGGKQIIGQLDHISSLGSGDVSDDSKVGVELIIDGQLHCFDKAVLALGAYSEAIAKLLNIKTRMDTERGYHIILENPSMAPSLPVMVADKKFVLHHMEMGLRAAGIVELGGVDLPPSDAPDQLLQNSVKHVYPRIKYDKMHHWMGCRPSTPDSLPLIGSHPNHPDIFFAAGHQHLGLTGGPRTGRIITDLIAGRIPNQDLTPFAVNRFE